MILKELIDKKDYDLIKWRITSPVGLEKPDIFFGYCKSENGKIISLDGDSYDENAKIIDYEEWSNEEATSGLTIIEEVEWS